MMAIVSQYYEIRRNQYMEQWEAMQKQMEENAKEKEEEEEEEEVMNENANTEEQDGKMDVEENEEN